MAKLSKKATSDIASLVNSITVAIGFEGEALQVADMEKFHRWNLSKARAACELADKYGIELPSLCIYRATVARADRG